MYQQQLEEATASKKQQQTEGKANKTEAGNKGVEGCKCPPAHCLT